MLEDGEAFLWVKVGVEFCERLDYFFAQSGLQRFLAVVPSHDAFFGWGHLGFPL